MNSIYTIVIDNHYLGVTDEGSLADINKHKELLKNGEHYNKQMQEEYDNENNKHEHLPKAMGIILEDFIKKEEINNKLNDWVDKVDGNLIEGEDN